MSRYALVRFYGNGQGNVMGPELTFPPTNPVWPPAWAVDPRTMRHICKSSEAFEDIARRYNVPGAPGKEWQTLVEWNFGLTPSEPKYFEKINWYLKHKLGSGDKEKTPKGNFRFKNGAVMYIPLGQTSFDEVAVIATESRLVTYSYVETNEVEKPETDGPNQGLMQIRDRLENWWTEKRTGHQPTPPNRVETKKFSGEIYKGYVLTEIHVRRHRIDMKPEQSITRPTIRTGSHWLHMDYTLIYGKGTKQTPVRIIEDFKWEQANGEVIQRNDASQTMDQPDDYSAEALSGEL